MLCSSAQFQRKNRNRPYFVLESVAAEPVLASGPCGQTRAVGGFFSSHRPCAFSSEHRWGARIPNTRKAGGGPLLGSSGSRSVAGQSLLGATPSAPRRLAGAPSGAGRRFSPQAASQANTTAHAVTHRQCHPNPLPQILTQRS